MIDFPSPHGTTPGYVSLPETGHGPGIVVIQEYWGLVPHVRDLVDRFAAAGFAAIAPDLYHGVETRSPDDATKLLMTLDIPRAGGEIRSAGEYLAAMPNVMPKKVGVVGFCMGGQLALYSAIEHPDVFAACVDFYGFHPKAPIDPAKLQVPVLAHFGNSDGLVKRGDAQAMVQRFSDAGKFIDAYYYDAGHAFFNDTRPEIHNPDASALAWDRTLAFLRDNLR